MKRLLIILTILALALPLFAFDFFFDSEEPNRNISFTLEGGVNTFFSDGELAPYTTLTLKAEQDGSKYRAIADLIYDSNLNTLEAQELSVSLFLGPITLKAGLMRHSWGTADTAHVVDIVNGRDLRRGIVDDLELMKRPDWMITLSTYGENSAFDMVVKPGFNPSLVAMDGRYSMMGPMTSLLSQLIPSILNPVNLNTLPITEMDTHTLSTISIGGRYRFIFDPVDVGFMYYYGYFPDSGFKLSLSGGGPFDLTGVHLQYTRYHFIGIESSYFFEPFTLACEGGMFLSEDKDGMDYSKYNSKLVYLAELSYTNPNNSFFAALNYQGQMVLNYDPRLLPIPIQYLDADLLASFDGKPYQNNFTLALEYPFMQEKLKVRVAGTYQLESMGFMALGSLTYDLDDAIEVFGKSTLYGTFDTKRPGLYNTWKDNSQIQVGVRAWF